MTQAEFEGLVEAAFAALRAAFVDDLAIICEERPELSRPAEQIALAVRHSDQGLHPAASDAARKLRQLVPWELPALAVANHRHENHCIRLLDMFADCHTVHTFGLDDKLAASISKFFLDDGTKIVWPADGALISGNVNASDYGVAFDELLKCQTIVGWYGLHVTSGQRRKLEAHSGFYEIGRCRNPK